MEIDASHNRGRQYLLSQHFPIVERKQNVRFHGADSIDPDGMIDVLWCEYRDVMLCRKFCNRIKPDVLVGIIHMRKNRTHLIAM